MFRASYGQFSGYFMMLFQLEILCQMRQEDDHEWGIDTSLVEGGHMRFEVSTAVKIQTDVFWVVMSCTVVVGYQCFRGLCCLCLQGEGAVMGKKRRDKGLISDFTLKMEAAVIQNVGILPQHYMMSQPRRT
jgi:hypothetical protein